MKKLTDRLLAKRKERYMGSQRDVLLTDDANQNFFKNAKAFWTGEKPLEFDVQELSPDKTDKEIAEALADHFNAISDEFSPLDTGQIPTTHNRSLPILLPFQVAGRLRAFRKPRSMVSGDIFPSLVTLCADLLALPLTDIYNTITTVSYTHLTMPTILRV